MALVKICGVRALDEALAAARAGAELIGVVFVQKSPRRMSPEDLADFVTDVKRACEDEALDPPHFVGLFIDPAPRLLAETAPYLSYFQFHGAETPARVDELGREFGVETIKAVGVGEASDLDGLEEYADAADLLLFDAKPTARGALPGGNGEAFDWSTLNRYRLETRFLLAGGLTPESVSSAVAAARGNAAFHGVDVSSGVEAAPGRKDPERIQRFVAAAKAAFAAT